jgi:Ca2+-binding RTX toxin-like protein
MIFGDDLLEVENVPEVFTVELSNPSIEVNVALSDFLGIGEIYDNEPGSVDGRGSDYQGSGIGGTDSTPGDNTPTEGDDVIHGTGEDDQIDGLAGHDVILGAGGDDMLDGSDGNDILEGKAGDDLLRGGDDNDVLDGGAGDDNLVGNTGDDLLAGQIGDDLLLGGQGNDVLLGGKGADTLDGGGGADVFKYTDLQDAGDTILDFHPNQGDAIDISELLDGYSQADPIENYVKFEASSAATTGSNVAYDLHVNPTGDVDGDFTLLATVHTTSQTDLDDMYSAVVASNQVT